ncbi:bifunctional 2-C-methyl-D-erythritol 4-phosphate cytidylyltransferase/2-C-methyl-D-erythritol 2,4-cyclodiphosphate synthase [Roseibium denhamense]|uniref:Bifunctional enzyme IspD/IspF n=1 Tax=Roseibium denhamense TaxID=76305 RepID=A0ABY1NPY6_9HYPH|nr:bifunctional 2-C-methyl-D-erythritol 4-phosphate cytidylyltransferase/2-C-methyl-D-erythritol 2,4-cyclodiphosphate synthase [Roseibium denhamense]MTI07883.1 bifunctional 2-C-methyl-D-erythritol 4-phosphate cytidylyltransferase/2-C-methyl-D-erythritol 2,4-cyclodiphosphate synthase [Roseibium denhamense]SMP14720.1 2-C-methyl-D-erythritol 2,4-cyclodiphosphate synthase [Roseibium denhamense]
MAKTAAALVVAAGRGTRLTQSASDLPKQYRHLARSPILSHTLNALARHPRILHILVVIHPDDMAIYDAAVACCRPETRAKLVPAVAGAQTRQGSVFNGLKNLTGRCDDVLIHDAARPFVSMKVLDRIFKVLETGADGALAAVPVSDTIKRSHGQDHPLETVDRTNLWAAQTPQAFSLEKILDAHTKAADAGRMDFTDDTGLAEWAGLKVMLSEGDASNFKITTPADLARAEYQARKMTTSSNQDSLPPLSELHDVRTGIGYDVHAFDDGASVILGGVDIAHTRSLKGHSDADVVLHAITDATLGAIGDGDIGQHFPPSDPAWKGAASDRFQIDAVRRVSERGGRLAHIDVTIVCEEPKIGPHRELIRASIAQICGLPLARVSVKATTSERLGFTGRKEGIAALASVTVRLPFKDADN